MPFGPAFGFGIYLHWPYCSRICPYCDFNVYSSKTRDTDPLLEAILRDLHHHARHLPDHPPLTSIFLGGGTPSLMTPQQVERVVQACERAFGLSPDCEITLEANPNNVSGSAARDWKLAGINRLSIGLQSLDDQALAFLGRDHTSTDARKAVDIARKQFSSFSIDMIYARPGQTVAHWETELIAALDLNAPHLSLYELTIAPETAFGKQVERGVLAPLPDQVQADMYELTEALTRAAGLNPYEISNHALTEDHQSRHNLTYWRSGDWLGLGPGAHGRLSEHGTRIATEAAPRPDTYIRAVEQTGTGLALRQSLSGDETLHELLTMGLRPTEGIALNRLTALTGDAIKNEKRLFLQDGGWLTESHDCLVLSTAGRLLADRIALELIS